MFGTESLADIKREFQLRPSLRVFQVSRFKGVEQVGRMSTSVAPIFKRIRLNADDSGPSPPIPSGPDPFQAVPSPILNLQRAPPRQHSPATFLPVQIELSHFRPVAFRVFTKKHNLTLKTNALAVLAEYIGRKCGSEWRVLGETVLDEIARAWARAEGYHKLYDEAKSRLESSC